MRGAFGAGVQAGFAEAGLPFDAFDALYGSSAGALNLMYWVVAASRASARGVYLDDLVRAEPARVLPAPHVPATCCGGSLRGLPGLDVARGRARDVGHASDRPGRGPRPSALPSGSPSRARTTSTTEMLDVRTLAPDDLLPTLLAGASVPVLADPATLGDGAVFDGAFVAPLPVDRGRSPTAARTWS